MELIDDRGRLFGLVNVVDAIVVLLVLAVVVAGVALVDPFAEPAEPPDRETRYATIDLGEQPSDVARQVSEGDVVTGTGTEDRLAVTDVYAAPGSDGNVFLAVRAEIDGTVAENGEAAFSFDGVRLRSGSELALDTPEYELAGRVVELGGDGAELDTTRRGVVVEAVVSASEGGALEVGDEYLIDGRTIATVESATSFRTSTRGERQVFLGLDLETIRRGDEFRFGTTPVRIDRTIGFVTEDYDLSGTIVASGTTEPPGEVVTRTITVEVSDVPPTIADSMTVGLEERTGDETSARVVDRDTEPATVILTTQDGEIHEREHPTNEDVTLVVEVRGRETPDGLSFHGGTLQVGDDVSFDFRTITVGGTVVEIETPDSSP